MAEEKIAIKDIKGLELRCNTCNLSLAYELSTQQTFISECPNCGAEWMPQQLNVDGIRGLKQIFKMLGNAQGAKLSLTYEKEQ